MSGKIKYGRKKIMPRPYGMSTSLIAVSVVRNIKLMVIIYSSPFCIGMG